MTRTCWRRWMLTIPCALALAGAALPFLGQSRAAPPPGEKYALLVGVREYDKNELRNLPYAEADVEALADVLRKAGYKRVVLMTQTEGARQARFLPLAANIRKTLKGLLEDRTENDSVLVAFAGHGVQYKGEDESYFCPMDAKLADRETLISLGEVYKAMEKSEAGMRLLFVDACRNDPRSDEARAIDKVRLESVTRPQKATPPGGVAAFFSCSAGEKAYENATLKHGVFFHFIIEGFQGKAANPKGEVGLDELVLYTKRQVSDFVREEYGDDVRQMPELIGKTRGLVSLGRLDGGGKPDAPDEPKSPDATIDETKPEKEYVNSIKMKLRLIPGGKFTMGSPKGEEGRDDNEGPQHEVEITKAFYLGVYPVTQDEYEQVAGKNPSSFSKEGYSKGMVKGLDTRRFPVESVTWDEAAAFCAALNKKDAKKPAGWVYELPTEAEWEYSCRAGTKTAYSFGDDPKDLGEYAWYSANSDGRSHEVGTKKANPWGLYDMHGNVWQWCPDGYDRYQEGSIKDPKGKESAVDRVLRGGSWHVVPRDCRSANRFDVVPAGRSGYVGFRVVLRLSARTP